MLGIGVNVAVALDELPAELRESAGTLGLAARRASSRRSRGCSSCSSAGSPRPTREVLDAWRERDALLGAQLSWREGSGVGAGIDERGRLLVAPAGARGIIALDAGEVHLVASGLSRPAAR